jgi:hypothetical protein
MAKVYTMEELERARKKAKIREWFQDKKVKAQTWCYEHKDQIITYGPVVVGGIAAGAKNAVEAHGTGQGAESEGSVLL